VVVTPPSSYDFRVVEKLVIVPRYLNTEFHVETIRRGLKGDIKFVARGGQLDQNRLRKPTIRPSLETGTIKRKLVTGTLRSYVNTALNPQRVTLTGTATTPSGRVINLTRIFALDVKISFRPATAVKKIELLPGESKKVRLLANRRDPFLGPLTIAISDLSAKGIVAPKQIKLMDAQPDAEITITVKKTAKPGKYNLGFSGSTRVNGLAESGGGDPLEIVVLKPKKKK